MVVVALEDCLVARKKSREKRKGRGFSRGELKNAGINVGHALRVGLPIDVRRKTIYEENVKLITEKLKGLDAPKKRPSGPKKS